MSELYSRRIIPICLSISSSWKQIRVPLNHYCSEICFVIFNFINLLNWIFFSLICCMHLFVVEFNLVFLVHWSFTFILLIACPPHSLFNWSLFFVLFEFIRKRLCVLSVVILSFFYFHFGYVCCNIL